MGKGMEKIRCCIQILGLVGMAVILFICFQGKDDKTLEWLISIGLIAAMLVFVFSYVVFSSFKSAGIQFILFAAVCIGIYIFAMHEGYGSKEVKDCGNYTFKAMRYWQEKHTTRVRHRLITSYVNYVEYKGFLSNGEKVVYKCSISTIGNAIDLVKSGATEERQVFAYNGNYYTKESGTSSTDFLSSFLRWRGILPVVAAIYAVLGILLILLEVGYRMGIKYSVRQE